MTIDVMSNSPFVHEQIQGKLEGEFSSKSEVTFIGPFPTHAFNLSLNLPVHCSHCWAVLVVSRCREGVEHHMDPVHHKKNVLLAEGEVHIHHHIASVEAAWGTQAVESGMVYPVLGTDLANKTF